MYWLDFLPDWSIYLLVLALVIAWINYEMNEWDITCGRGGNKPPDTWLDKEPAPEKVSLKELWARFLAGPPMEGE